MLLDEKDLQIMIKALSFYIERHKLDPIDLSFEKFLLDNLKEEALKV